MKVLLAGGAGYVGSVLARELVDRGYEVKVIDLLWFGNHLPPQVEVDQKDLFDTVEDDLHGFDQVVFLGGLSNDPMAEFSPSMNFRYNAALPAYLSYMSKRAGVNRFIYASSCSVYGYTVDEMYDEEAMVACGYPYGISKLQGERGVMQMQDATFSVISLRNGTVCGHSPRMRFDLIVNTMFKSALTTGAIVVNNPSIWRPIVHIQDEASAYIRAIQANYGISGIFNIASDNYTVGQVGDLVRSIIQERMDIPVHLDIRNVQDFRNYKVKIDRARTYLGFQPRHSVDSIVNELIMNRDQYGDFENDEFYNIRTFKKLLEPSVMKAIAGTNGRKSTHSPRRVSSRSGPASQGVTEVVSRKTPFRPAQKEPQPNV